MQLSVCIIHFVCVLVTIARANNILLMCCDLLGGLAEATATTSGVTPQVNDVIKDMLPFFMLNGCGDSQRWRYHRSMWARCSCDNVRVG